MSEPERNRYEEIFEEAPIARLITDTFGTVCEANRAAAELLKVSPSFLVGKPLAIFVREDERRGFRERLLAVTETTNPTTWLTWLETNRTGSSFRAEVHVVVSQSDVGQLHWAITDVTERMAMEQELRVLTGELETRVAERTREVEAERARLAAVVDQIPAGLVIIGSDGRAVMANAEARRLLGDRVIDGIQGLPSSVSEGVEEGRAEILSDDGSRVLLEVWIAPIVDAAGDRAGAVQLFQDVSVRERQERAEREFVTNAAHQLQSPLAGIISAVDVLQSGAKEGPEREVFLGHIEREANRLARLTRALLILARAQTGVETPKDEVVALCPLLSEVCSAVRPAPGVRIDVECPMELAVVTNRELVEQALLNVTENAAKYTTEGRITLAARPLDGGAEIVVSDTGPGIPRLEHDRVAERFYRGARDGSDGFGLGFAIVRSAIEALDGELELDEPETGGTVVRIRLRQAATIVESA